MTYDELAGSPQESIDEGSGPSCQRRFLVPWGDRLTFAQSFVAGSTAYPSDIMSRVVGISLQPWNEDTVPSGILVTPPTEMVDYGDQGCLVTVQYGPDYTRKDWPADFTKPTFREGTELRYQIRGSAKFLLIPCSATKWEDNPDAPVPEDANTSILIPLRSIQLQWDFVDNPSIDDAEAFQGKLNSDTFLGCEAETLLFESYEISETFRASVDNPHTNRITVNLTARRINTGSGIVGWNHDFRETPAGWAKLLLSDGLPRYKSTAFAGMFA